MARHHDKPGGHHGAEKRGRARSEGREGHAGGERAEHTPEAARQPTLEALPKGSLGQERPLRADDEARTRDLNLGKVALYQLSYVRLLPRRGSVRTEQ